MAVNSTWTNPTTLDKTTGQQLDLTTYEAVLSDLNAIGGSTGHLKSGGYPVLEASGATAPHLEQSYDPALYGTAAGALHSATLTFARAFASNPSIGASCSTTGAAGSVTFSILAISTTAVTIAFKNNDTGTVNLSDTTITAVGI